MTQIIHLCHFQQQSWQTNTALVFTQVPTAHFFFLKECSISETHQTNQTLKTCCITEVCTDKVCHIALKLCFVYHVMVLKIHCHLIQLYFQPQTFSSNRWLKHGYSHFICSLKHIYDTS